jgi:hypothetical protein
MSQERAPMNQDQTSARQQRAYNDLKKAVRKECQRQLQEFFRLAAGDDGSTMLDVVTAHVALGYGINVGVQVRHPEEDGRAEEDPAARDQPPPSRIQVVPG